MVMAPISIIILTLNEEENLPFCLESVKDLSDDIFVVDSYSTDKTIEVARQYTDTIYQNAWINYADQRNWALENLPLSHEWVLFLDADERLTKELVIEIKDVILNSDNHGFYIKLKYYFLGRWIKYGGQSAFRLRLFRKKHAYVIKKGALERLVVNGSVGYLKNTFLHEDKKGLYFWIDKHNKYASLEAKEYYILYKEKIKNITQSEIIDNEYNHVERKKVLWLKEKIYNRLPLFIRPFIFFIYSYFIRLGFLDGKEGFIYCFLQKLWYHILVDAKYLEFKKRHEG